MGRKNYKKRVARPQACGRYDRHCKNCQMLDEQHRNGKCLFQPTSYAWEGLDAARTRARARHGEALTPHGRYYDALHRCWVDTRPALLLEQIEQYADAMSKACNLSRDILFGTSTGRISMEGSLTELALKNAFAQFVVGSGGPRIGAVSVSENCRNCARPMGQHVEGKCLFEPTSAEGDGVMQVDTDVQLSRPLDMISIVVKV